jgi:acyl carrier protein
MSSIEEGVIRAIGKIVKDREVRVDSTFEELGMDSLAIIEAAFEIEEEFDLRIPDGDMKQIRGVRDVIDGVARLLSEKS